MAKVINLTGRSFVINNVVYKSVGLLLLKTESPNLTPAAISFWGSTPDGGYVTEIPCHVAPVFSGISNPGMLDGHGEVCAFVVTMPVAQYLVQHFDVFPKNIKHVRVLSLGTAPSTSVVRADGSIEITSLALHFESLR